MSDILSRREFLGTASGLAAGAALPPATGARLEGPAVIIRPQGRNVAVASLNGLRAVQKVADLLDEGVDTLDAAIEGVKIQELDPSDHSVGYGGLPNEEGIVQLDASCMHGPTRRAGAVGCLEGIKTPSVVAKYVMLYTNHIFLAGEGAKRFALSYGFEETDMLTDEAREIWLHWRANRGSADEWRDVPRDERLSISTHGTINCNVVNAKGEISSVTTTSGVSWKVPGRVGDSPIIGAGQYTDPEVGAAGSTGLGEANIKICGAFLTVEHMRRGMSPTDACLETLRRVAGMTEDRLLDEHGRPTFGLTFYAVNKRGVVGGANLAGAGQYAVFDGREVSRRDLAVLYE